MKNKFKLKANNFVIEASEQNDPWNTPWNIYTTYDHELIGTVSFAGEKALGTVPICVELKSHYQNKGYGTEIYRMMVSWAFSHSNVYEVKGTCDTENDRCIIAMEKAGFVYRSKEDHIETYSVIKRKTTWLGLYMVIGFNVGLVLALVLNSPWVGLAIGLFVCITLGTVMDQKEQQKREAVTGKKLE